MIQQYTLLKVADNSGVRRIRAITPLGSNVGLVCSIGDIISANVREAEPESKIPKGKVIRAVVVRTRKEVRRKDGSYIRFDDNACVIIDKKTKEPKGTRIFGPVARELRARGYTKIISLAPEVV